MCYYENSRLFLRDFVLRGLFKERIHRIKRAIPVLHSKSINYSGKALINHDDF